MMRWEARKIRKDGTMLWVRETANAVSLKKRPVLLVACEDITEKKRAEEAARRSEKELLDVINTIPGKCLERFERWCGRFRQPASGGLHRAAWARTSRDGTGHPSFIPWTVSRYVADWLSDLKTGRSQDSEVRVRSANGQYCWFLVRRVPLRDEAGGVLRWYGVFTDIDDRKRAEALLAGEKRVP